MWDNGDVLLLWNSFSLPFFFIRVLVKSFVSSSYAVTFSMASHQISVANEK